MNDLLNRLNLDEVSALFDECYEKISGDTSVPVWLTEEFIKEVDKNYGLLPTQLDVVLDCLDIIVKNPDLVMYSKVLYEMLGTDGDGREMFKTLAFPDVEGGNMIGVYPMLAHYIKTYDELKDSGIGEEVLKNTFCMLDLYLHDSEKLHKKAALSPGGLTWTNLAKSKSLFRIDRLNLEVKKKSNVGVYGFKNAKGEIKVLMDSGFKIAKDGFVVKEDGDFVTEFCETDEYYEGFEADSKTATVTNRVKLSKGEWTPFYRPGDDIVSVHIPMAGSFEPQVVDSALSKGREFLKKHFPEVCPKAYFCYSWLLAPELAEFLKPESNVLHFQNRFSKFPDSSCHGKDVFTYVYVLPQPKTLAGYDFTTLPENSSLQKKIKDHYLSGKIVHETSGIYPY